MQSPPPAQSPSGELQETLALSEMEERLLSAAEALIVEKGIGQLRTRAIADRAGVNMGMIRYTFQGIDGLLSKLLLLNLDAYVRRQSVLARTLGKHPNVESILFALFAPQDTPAIFTPNAHASTILYEILPRALEATKALADERLGANFRPLMDRLVEACPHLSRDMVIWRVWCVMAGGISLYPNGPAWQLFDSLVGHKPWVGSRRLAELVATVAGALNYPAPSEA